MSTAMKRFKEKVAQKNIVADIKATKRRTPTRRTLECHDCGDECNGDHETPDGYQCDDCAEEGGVWVSSGNRFRRLR